MQSATTICGFNVSVLIFSRCSTLGYRPTDVALMTMSVSAGMLKRWFHKTNEAFVGVCWLSISTNIRPSSEIFTTVISEAPASAISTQMARDAPPAPNTTSFFPCTDVTSDMAFTKPLPSVFSPRVFPSFSMMTVLTAPIIRADSPNSSRYLITSTLLGMEQLKPLQPIAFAPATAASSLSGPTSQFM